MPPGAVIVMRPALLMPPVKVETVYRLMPAALAAIVPAALLTMPPE